MGYFSNGSEGAEFTAHYCEHCVNWRDLDDGRGVGCPIWDAHLLYAYELCNKKTPGKTILDMLIEPTEDGCGNRCLMFQSVEAVVMS